MTPGGPCAYGGQRSARRADYAGVSRGFRIAGFSDRGEARIVDAYGRLVGYGELLVDDAHLTGMERGEVFALSLRVTWTPELPDPDCLDVDWDGLLS